MIDLQDNFLNSLFNSFSILTLSIKACLLTKSSINEFLNSLPSAFFKVIGISPLRSFNFVERWVKALSYSLIVFGRKPRMGSKA